MRVFLSTPCYGGVCQEAFATSILKLQLGAAAQDIMLTLDTTENESLVQRARNISVARFLYKSDADYFMFIDSDIHFDPESVFRLLKSGYDVSVAVYPKKVIMWDQVAHCVSVGDTRPPDKLSASLVTNFADKSAKLDSTGFAEVLDGPTGFMLIKRNVIELMYKRYENELTCVNDHQNRDIEKYVAIFDCMIDPVSNRYLSEDYAFCRRWQMMGGKIYADCCTSLGHVGTLRFIGNMEERIKANTNNKNKNGRTRGKDQGPQGGSEREEGETREPRDENRPV